MKLLNTYLRKITIGSALLILIMVISIWNIDSSALCLAPFGTTNFVVLWLPFERIDSMKSLVHTVKAGENLNQISQQYFVNPIDILKTNLIRDPNNIQVGQIINIPPPNFRAPFLQVYPVKAGETAEVIMKSYGLERWQFERLNPLYSPELFREGMKIVLPRTKIYPDHVETSVLRSSFIIPVRGVVTSRFGWRWGRMHTGLDLGAPMGAPVKAATDGKVVYAGWCGGYGQLIKVNLRQYTTYYGHLSKIIVKVGETVKQGQLIGLVGSTGYSFGSHLHFEVEQNGKKMNPVNYLP